MVLGRQDTYKHLKSLFRGISLNGVLFFYGVGMVVDLVDEVNLFDLVDLVDSVN